MKKITITNAFSVKTKTRHSELKDVFAEGMEEMEASDGYHTFGELYEHRIVLFITLCRTLDVLEIELGKGIGRCWKSKYHSDGTSWDGWFIAGIDKEKGEQKTYHLPISYWNKLDIQELDKAPEWDGHTPNDVINRLLGL